MPEIESYDVLVIGSGEAGKYLAWTMAKAGHRTAVVERNRHLRDVLVVAALTYLSK